MKYSLNNFEQSFEVDIIFSIIASNYTMVNYIGTNGASDRCFINVKESDEPIELIYETPIECKYLEYLLKEKSVTISRQSTFLSIGGKRSSLTISNICKSELNKLGCPNHSYEDIIWKLLYEHYSNELSI